MIPALDMLWMSCVLVFPLHLQAISRIERRYESFKVDMRLLDAIAHGISGMYRGDEERAVAPAVRNGRRHIQLRRSGTGVIRPLLPDTDNK